MRQTETRVLEGVVGESEPYFVDWSYDLVGRPVQITYPESTRVRYEYERAYLKRVCDLGTATDCSGATVAQYVSDVDYDWMGRREMTVMEPGSRTFTYAGSTSRLHSDRFDAGPESAYNFLRTYEAYDGLGNVTNISGSSQPADVELGETFEYDARNRLRRWKRGDGPWQVYDYDPLGNLTLHAGAVQTFGASDRPHAIQQRADGAVYGYDPDGNVTSIVGGGSTRSFQFDSANRLVCAGSTPASPCGLTRIRYDVDGRQVVSGDPENLDYTVDVAGGVRVQRSLFRQVDIEIHAFGERIALKQSTDPLRTADLLPFVLPPELPLAAGFVALAGLVAFAIRAGVPILVIRRPGYAGTASLLVVVLVLGPAPPLRAGGGSSTVIHWELADRLGTGMVIVDDTGARLLHRTFTPFGEVDKPPAGNATWLPRTYAGHRFDDDAGIYSMQARWYDAKSGTFLSVDPLVSDSADPQSLNAYAYARNNPVSFIDPTGSSFELPYAHPGFVFTGYTDTGVPIYTAVGFSLEIAMPDGGLSLNGIEAGPGPDLSFAPGPMSISLGDLSIGPSALSLANSSQVVADPFVYEGGTPEEQKRVDVAADRVFATDRGKKALEKQRGRGEKFTIRLNREGKNGAPIPGNEADINVDSDKQPFVETTEGKIKMSLERAIAHEVVGHAIFGTRDSGAGNLLNVLRNENPIMRELGEPDRIRY